VSAGEEKVLFNAHPRYAIELALYRQAKITSIQPDPACSFETLWHNGLADGHHVFKDGLPTASPTFSLLNLPRWLCAIVSKSIDPSISSARAFVSILKTWLKHEPPRELSDAVDLPTRFSSSGNGARLAASSSACLMLKKAMPSKLDSDKGLVRRASDVGSVIDGPIPSCSERSGDEYLVSEDKEGRV
jgi:hypothetical protein